MAEKCSACNIYRKHILLCFIEAHSRMGHENEMSYFLEEEHYSQKKTCELSYTSSKLLRFVLQTIRFSVRDFFL